MKEHKLSDVPMMTADQQPITINKIIYDFDYSAGRSFEGVCKIQINPYRVISVNNQQRNYVVRCSKGCETMVVLKDGCARQRYWGSFVNAKKEVDKLAFQDFKKCEAKAKKVKSTQAIIRREQWKLYALKAHQLKSPKAVRVTK